ncbi:MAG: 2-polyprenyl-3-methyl-6-methoxy-1,4-benzoquinone monooxygenase [Betaproteobacteria bacterium]|nr:2-polyprenyl-3-methyl-6-methoxy-1,4-benzoquinone monooxygenase [Betaproteobacteria bacterium]PWB60942.1 MAG: demethoxyubiquinone hydroxylase family protein [Betaproteobacteria bacterium]
MATSSLDRLLIAADNALRTLSGAVSPSRPTPGRKPGTDERAAEAVHVAGLMRVDHAGEVCAQALYAGQSLMARDPGVRAALEKAGAEERDHLAWCAERLRELDSHPSLLSPFWYAGSFALGVVSGAAGDRWSMGFLVETERQVEKHIDGHIEQLPPEDARSRAILEQMRVDEIAHARSGLEHGGEELPAPVKGAMRLMAKVMTETAYRF